MTISTMFGATTFGAKYPTSPEVSDLDTVKKDLDKVVGQIKAAMAADQWDDVE